MKAIRWLPLLVLAGATTPAFAQNQSRSQHTWQREQKPDPSRGITTIQFTLTGRFLDPPRGNVPGAPYIMLSCLPSQHGASSEGKFISGQIQAQTPLKVAFVEPDEIHGTSYIQKINVEYHVDNEKPHNVEWPPRSDKTSISLDKEAARKLLRGRELVLSMEEPFESKVVIHFDVPESADVLNACGIREHK